MKRILSTTTILLLSIATAVAQQVGGVFGFPSTEPGYSLGVSACYAGQIGDWLVVAGGCNFPTQGNKKYYAGIYAARVDDTVLDWRLVGMLPEPAAYGGAVASGDSLLFIGGNNSEHALNTVYSIHLNARGDRADVSRVASLPATVDNMAVAKSGDNVYVAGGNHDGKPSASVIGLDLSACDGKWRAVGSVPGGPRVQPVCAAYDNKVYVWGGFHADGQNSVVHTDGQCLDTSTGKWTPLEAPRSVDGGEITLSGGIAWTCGGRIFATGGVNKDIFLDAISGRYKLVDKADYLLQPIEWYRFSGNLCEFDPVSGKWQKTRFAAPALARAGAQVITAPSGVYYIGGELKPALRTPQIVKIVTAERQ